MKRKLEFTAFAVLDLHDALQYHEAESPMLRDRFAAAVEAAVAEVEKRPNAYPVVTGKFRRVPVHGFRYGVYYRILASLILVSAVYHASRDIGSLHKRK